MAEADFFRASSVCKVNGPELEVAMMSTVEVEVTEVATSDWIVEDKKIPSEVSDGASGETRLIHSDPLADISIVLQSKYQNGERSSLH